MKKYSYLLIIGLFFLFVGFAAVVDKRVTTFYVYEGYEKVYYEVTTYPNRNTGELLMVLGAALTIGALVDFAYNFELKSPTTYPV